MLSDLSKSFAERRNASVVAKRPQGKMSGFAFTLVELLTVVAIIAVIAAILFPVLTESRRRGHLTTCTSNLRQIGAARAMYMQDYDENPPSQLHMLWPSYATSKEIFICPLDQWTRDGGWAWVNWGIDTTPPQKWRVPISYIYVQTLNVVMDSEEEKNAQNPGYAVCVLHGTPFKIQPERAPYYYGAVLRLRFDNSVMNIQRGVKGSFSLTDWLAK